MVDDRSTGPTPASTRRHRARRGDGQQLRQQIIHATARLLADTGDEEAVSIRSIADAVGVTPPSIYLHFADKTELVFAVCDEHFRELDRRSEEAAAGARDPFDEIHLRGQAYVRFGLENPEQYRILFMGRHQPDDVSPEQVEQWASYQHMVDAVRRAMDAGMVEPGDPQLVTIGLWAAVHGITSLMVAKPTFPWPPVDVVVGQVMAMCTFGVVRRDIDGRPAVAV